LGIVAKYYLLSLLLFVLLVWPFFTSAEILKFDCAVNGVEITLNIDTEAQKVEQIARSEDMTEIGEYSDGIYGPVSHTGAAGALIPRVHQFVHISELAIQFGAELKGAKDVATVDRRLGILTLPKGQSGWCFQK
jgi:hypothetical protein